MEGAMLPKKSQKCFAANKFQASRKIGWLRTLQPDSQIRAAYYNAYNTVHALRDSCILLFVYVPTS